MNAILHHRTARGALVATALVCLQAAQSPGQETITTIAGGGPFGGPATDVNIGTPRVAVDSLGNVFIAALSRVFKVDASGQLSVVAGNGTPGFSGDGGPATEASLVSPVGIAIGSSGNIYIADNGDARVRKVDSNGIITTVAGNGTLGPTGDGGPATSAGIGHPRDVALDSAGNLYIADSHNRHIRKVDTSGVITTVAGGGSDNADGIPATSAHIRFPFAVALDSADNLYIVDAGRHRVRKVDASGIITTVAGNDGIATGSIDGEGGFPGDDLGDGGLATAASLKGPFDVAFDSADNLYIADRGNHRTRRVDASGIITTVAGNGVPGFSGDGASATSASLRAPAGVVLDNAGNLYIGDGDNHRVRKVDSSGIITTIAGNGFRTFSGDGGAAASASLASPMGVALDSAGNLYIADSSNARVRKVDASGIITTVAGGGVDASDGIPATSAGLRGTRGVVLDNAGSLYIAESNRIRKVDAGGIITTVAGDRRFDGFSGDGGPATSARLRNATGIALDSAGNLYIADQGNHRIRRVDTSGIITTVAGNGVAGFSGDGGPATSASLRGPFGVAVDGGGNIYIADTLNHRIRKVAAGGIITTIAGDGIAAFSGDGGPAESARLKSPFGLVLDEDGSLYIADFNNHRIRRVDISGIITTVVGNGVAGFGGDGGPPSSASLRLPTSVALDADGDLYISGFGNNRIRFSFADCNLNGVPDTQELDRDEDGVIDDCDQCPGFDDNLDADADGVPDGCDPDDDNDGILDEVDLQPFVVSTRFSDERWGGVTSGEVVGGLVDGAIPEGVEIRDARQTARGIEVEITGPDVVEVTFDCAFPVERSAGPSTIAYTCGSLSIDAIFGSTTATFTIDGVEHEVVVDAGGAVTLEETLDEFGELATVTVTVAADSQPDSVSVDGQDAVPGQTANVLGVEIDIKPGSFPNTINLGSHGTVPIAIFSTATFDATSIDPLSVSLAGAAVRLRGRGTPQVSFEDIDGDGLLDLVVHVDTEALELSETDTGAALSGSIDAGSNGITIIRGLDTIRVVP